MFGKQKLHSFEKDKLCKVKIQLFLNFNLIFMKFIHFLLVLIKYFEKIQLEFV